MRAFSKITLSSIFSIIICFSHSCEQPAPLDPSKIYDQKHVDSTLYMMLDSLEKEEYRKYEELLNDEAQKIADSILKSPKKSVNNSENELRTEKPQTQNLPEPTGPDYKFPEK